jgi:hypothetical protein
LLLAAGVALRVLFLSSPFLASLGAAALAFPSVLGAC